MKNFSRFQLPAAFLVIASVSFAADIETAIELYNNKNFDAAEAELRALVSEDESNPEANLYLGRVLIEKEAYDEAEPILRRAAEASEAKARVELGKVHMFQDELDAAVADFQAALPAEEKNSDLFLHYGMTLLKQQKAGEAATQLSKAIQLDEKNAFAYYYLGLAQNQTGRADLMLENFRKFVALAPDSPEAARVKSLLRTR